MLITAWMYLGFTVLLLLQHIYYTRIRAAPAVASTCKVGCAAALQQPAARLYYM